MADLRLRALPCACALAASALTGCLLYEDRDDPDVQPDAAAAPDARAIDAAPDAPVDAGIDAPRAAPTIELRAPQDGALVTHHDAVRIDARVTGNPIAGFDLTVDGVAAPASLSVTGVPVGGDCYAGCDVSFWWDADAMREGMHTAQLDARDDLGARASASLTLRFEDAPQITFVRPTGEARGATSTTIQAVLVDRGPGPISATLSIDGVAAHTATYADCLTGCTLARTWETSALASGTHTLSITASDAVGHTTAHAESVVLADIPYLTQLNVNESDGFGTLEVEVHLYDAVTDEWLGCSGDDFGLANVAMGNVLYSVQAWFVDANRRPLGVDQLAGRQLRVRVIEDDFQECPARPAQDDDEIADWEPISAAALPGLSTSHGDVLQLTTRTGRILAR